MSVRYFICNILSDNILTQDSCLTFKPIKRYLWHNYIYVILNLAEVKLSHCYTNSEVANFSVSLFFFLSLWLHNDDHYILNHDCLIHFEICFCYLSISSCKYIFWSETLFSRNTNKNNNAFSLPTLLRDC